MNLFAPRKPSVDLARSRIRRLVDLTVDTAFADDEPRRVSPRYSRSIPVLLVPWQNGTPLLDAACFAVTRNISDGGFALILAEPLRHPRVCVAFLIPDDASGEPCFLLGDCKHLTPIGGGFWSLGIEVTECASEICPEELTPFRGLAAQLKPERETPAEG